MAVASKRFAIDSVMEAFAMVGAPARMFGRLPLVTRYVWSGFSRPWYSHPYAESRWGHSYRWRPWLLFDMLEIQMVEELINEASDKRVLDFRRHQMESLNMIAVVAALVAGVAVTALQLPGVDGVSYVTRACFSLALVIALFSTFFTCLQQRTYGFIEEPGAIRAWLSNGIRYVNYSGKEVYQSSSVSHNLLQIPFELLCIAITTFLLGFSVYLGSAWKQDLPLGLPAEQAVGNMGVLILFIVGSVFALALLGQILGTKDVERNNFLNLNPDGSLRITADGGGVPPTLEEPSFSPTEVKRANTGERLGGFSSNMGRKSEVTIRSGGSSEEREKNPQLVQALRRAAEAHREAAAADAEVAKLLEDMSATS